MKKICILQNSMTYGGTDTFVINLCRGLVRDGYEVTVVLSMDDRNPPRLDELKSTGASIVWTCSLRGVSGTLKHLRLLFRELRRGRYDAFQTNIDLMNGPQLFVAWLAGVPVRECHSHNSQQGRELSEGRTLSVRLYQALMRWLCRRFSNRRGGCSAAAMDFLFESGWRYDPHSVVINNGIDLSTFRAVLDISAKKETLGLNRQFTVSTVGRIDFQKNPEMIVEILKELFLLRSDWDFVWVGTGESENEIRRRVSDYQLSDRVHFLGARNDVSEILRCCDIFLLPSRFEGLGIVLIEAQAAGLPCVISDVVPAEADCGACLAISLNQPASFWAEQISEILDGKSSLKADPQKIDTYSIDHMVAEMEELFES